MSTRKTIALTKTDLCWQSMSLLFNMLSRLVKIDSQWEFAVWHRELKSGALSQPRGVKWGERWGEGSGARGHMYAYN